MQRDDSSSTSNEGLEAVAVVGMACRFPGASGVAEFWHNLRAGVESISFFTDEELERAGVRPEVYRDPAYIRAKGVLDGIEFFDAAFFGFTPREAEVMDPQHRLFLECAWEALENAGYDFGGRSGRIGVYGGSAMSTYLLFNLLSNPAVYEAAGGLQLRMLNDKDFLTTLVSYKLNLRGPSIAVQTACSTSLVAAHMSCQALLDGECDMALAGGVAVSFPHRSGYFYEAGGIWSPDGHCRSFDAAAAGTVEGNGAGVVVLKRLEDALRDGDFVHALIRGSAVNNDGSLKAGFTAPSVESQAQVVLEALSLAGVSPETVTYVEAHGSATPLGDPIEVRALTKAFRASTPAKNFCALGSVKSNLGHLDNAAGVASLIKTVSALKERIIPPTLHFREANPQLELADSPFYVNPSAVEWEARGGHPRRAGVSSLGIGGTNVHLVLEEAPAAPPAADDGAARPYQLLLLSARTESALDAATANLAAHLRRQPELNLADAAHTLHVGRREFEERRALVCRDAREAADALESLDPARVMTGACEASPPEVAFMFPGLGDQHARMAADLYRAEQTFRKHFDICAELLKPGLGRDLREVLYPAGAEGAHPAAPPPSLRRSQDLRKLLAREEGAPEDEGARLLNQTSVAQPAVFAVEYALAQLWMSWGVRPAALIGYSIGEYVAACLAGVFTLEDALLLVAGRARIIQELPGGSMLAVPLAAEEVGPLLADARLSLCASNGPALSVVGGPRESVETFERLIDERGVAFRRLQTSHAFHSSMMEPAVEPFERLARTVRYNAPRTPVLSNVTGTWLTAGEAADPAYWARHMRRTVRFAEGLQELLNSPARVLLEVGPGQSLGTLARQQAASVSARRHVFSSMRDRREEASDVAFLLTTLGRLWLAGVGVDWRGFHAHERRRRVPLPTYPFERRRYWVEPGALGPAAATRRGDEAERRQDLADWFYVPVWKRSRPRPAPREAGQRAAATRWLVFLDDTGLGRRVARGLEGERGCEVTRVKAGEQFDVDEDGGAYTINPGRREDYDALIKEVREWAGLPTHVAHLWSVGGDCGAPPGLKSFDPAQERGFYSLLFLAQALGEHGAGAPLRINVVSDNLHDVTGEESCCPHKATLWGPCKVIPQEYPGVTCRSIDLESAGTETPRDDEGEDARGDCTASRRAAQLVAELVSDATEQAVAYRGRHRWVRDFEPARIERPATGALRAGGHYFITGAEAEIGLVLAEHLVRTAGAKAALVAAPDFPAQERWERWLGAHDDEDEVSRKVRRLRALEAEAPGRVLLITADVTSAAQMESALARARAGFGALDGVIHAAGAPGAGIIQLKTAEAASAVLAPKAKGALVLASLLEGTPLDFFALFSSTASVAGGFGQSDTCAANAFLDAFAQQRSAARAGGRTVAVNWSAFQWDEWQSPAPATLPGLQEQLQENLRRNGISARESVECFERALDGGSPQVVVCPQDLGATIAQTDAFTVTSFLEEARRARPAEAHPRPALGVAYVEPRDETERTIAALWQEAFGIERIGVEDNFFDLAGNSLLAIQLVTRLRRAFGIELPMTSLFDAPTVAALAQKIRESHAAPTGQEEMERLLAEIEGLSLDEAERNLAEELGAGE